jgi:hypothetical protein
LKRASARPYGIGPVLNVLRGLDARRRARALPTADRRQILFDLRNEFGATCAAPVVQALVARGHRVHTVFGGEAGDVSRWPHAMQQLNELRATPGAARWTAWDAVVCTDKPSVRYQRWSRSFYLHHGAGSGSGERCYPVEVCAKHTLDAILSPGPQAAAYERAEINRQGLATVVHDVGFPKLDALARGLYERPVVIAQLGLDRSLPTVLIGSHWTRRGLLPEFGPELIRQIAQLGRHNIVVQGHPLLWTRPLEWITPEWRKALDETCGSLGTVRVVRVPDVRPLLAVADVLVSDHSSVALEYAVLQRPMVLFSHAEHAWGDTRLRELVGRHAWMSSSKDELLAGVQRALHGDVGPQDHGPLVAHCFSNVGTAAERAADAILGV